MAAAAEVAQLQAELDSERSHVASLMAALAKAKVGLERA
jgi:multidrug resistance efflux pump